MNWNSEKKETYVQLNKEGEFENKTDTQAQTAENPNIQRSIDKHVGAGWLLSGDFQTAAKNRDATRVQAHCQAVRHSVDMAETGKSTLEEVPKERKANIQPSSSLTRDGCGLRAPRAYKRKRNLNIVVGRGLGLGQILGGLCTTIPAPGPPREEREKQ